jgi:hypothetical protein
LKAAAAVTLHICPAFTLRRQRRSMLQLCVNPEQRLSATLARWRGVMSMCDSNLGMVWLNQADRRAPARLSGTFCWGQQLHCVKGQSSGMIWKHKLHDHVSTACTHGGSPGASLRRYTLQPVHLQGVLAVACRCCLIQPRWAVVGVLITILGPCQNKVAAHGACTCLAVPRCWGACCQRLESERWECSCAGPAAGEVAAQPPALLQLWFHVGAYDRQCQPHISCLGRFRQQRRLTMQAAAAVTLHICPALTLRRRFSML